MLISMAGVLLPPPLLADLPGGAEKLDGFEQGFVEALQARIELETRSTSTYRANHQEWLRQAGRSKQRR